MSNITKSEAYICAQLRPMLASIPDNSTIDYTDDLRNVLSALEYFLPEVLGEIHPEWKHESLDGIYPEVTRKTGNNEIEIVGLCLLISDQTFAPLHLRLQFDAIEDTVSWFECRLGEATANGMLRIPFSPDIALGNQLRVLARLDSIDWVYCVGYGKRGL